MTPGPTAPPTPAESSDAGDDGGDGNEAATPAPEPLAPTPVLPLDWRSCGDLECATLTVPIDHADPSGPTLDLAVARSPVRSTADAIGSLVMNPGGPGASGIDFLRSFAPSAPAELAERFHLVSWDPRGVGDSSGLRCNPDIDDDLRFVADVDDGVADDVAELAADNAELAEACRSDHPELIDHVGTLATVRDLELLRAALGDEGLSYLGFSYGTRIGAVYATEYPDRVRAMVLDGAFPPNLDPDQLTEAAADFDAVLGRIDRVCDLEPRCPVADAGLTETFVELLDRFAGDEPDGDAFDDRTALVGATLLAIYAPSAWEIYAGALAAADDGDTGELRRLADLWFRDPDDGRISDIYLGSNLAIMCADAGLPSDEAAAIDDSELALDAAPLFGPLFVSAGCAGWDATTEPLPPIDTTGAPTIVVIGSVHDPATPLRWAEQLVDDLADAVLVVSTADGHTAASNGDACVDGAVAAYIVALRPPPDGLVCEAPTGLLGVAVETFDGGLRITDVAPDSAADRAGIERGDVVVSVDGEPVFDPTGLLTGAGVERRLEIVRDGERRTVTVTADRRPWTLPADG